jgi:hypothetical protein
MLMNLKTRGHNERDDWESNIEIKYRLSSSWVHFRTSNGHRKSSVASYLWCLQIEMAVAAGFQQMRHNIYFRLDGSNKRITEARYMKFRLPLWSSGQSSWLQIQRFWVRFPALPDFLRSSGSGRGSTQPREDNWGATWMKKYRLPSRKPN